MTWSTFAQNVILLFSGAWIYSCGRAGASLLAPLENTLRRAGELMIHRRSQKAEGNASITPNHHS